MCRLPLKPFSLSHICPRSCSRRKLSLVFTKPTAVKTTWHDTDISHSVLHSAAPSTLAPTWTWRRGTCRTPRSSCWCTRWSNPWFTCRTSWRTTCASLTWPWTWCRGRTCCSTSSIWPQVGSLTFIWKRSASANLQQPYNKCDWCITCTEYYAHNTHNTPLITDI